ncbi:MAG TPA: RraA family protein [Streptosporangiaceae bacterium]|jgi:RraA family protein
MTANWPAGFVINDRVAPADRELIDQYRGIPTAFVSDAMGKSTGGYRLRSFGSNEVMCGPAVTVRVRPGDNLMVHKSFDLAQPGDVIVVDAGGEIAQAIIGGNMRVTMMRRGFAGIVIDGAIRDILEFADGAFPTYALANAHRGPSKDGPGEINVPISCAGMVVHPGDLVIGDPDGVVTVPKESLLDLLPRVQEVVKREARLRAQIESGTTDPDRFNSILRAKGCPL